MVAEAERRWSAGLPQRPQFRSERMIHARRIERAGAEDVTTQGEEPEDVVNDGRREV